MTYCRKCGAKVQEGTRFCPMCGAVVGEIIEDTAAQDIQNNKAMAILSYIGILVLVPLFAAKDSKFARFHANQGLVLLILEIAYGILCSILSGIIMLISWRLLFIMRLFGVIGMVFVAPIVIGIVNAANGDMKELPIIGSIRLLP